jgi:dihydropteroate synthase
VAGPGPGVPPAARRDCPLLLAVENIGTRAATALRRVLTQFGGSAFFGGSRSADDSKRTGRRTPHAECPNVDPEAPTPEAQPFFLSGTPGVFVHLFTTMEEPLRGLWQALTHALTAYDAALARTIPTRVMGVLNVTPDSFSDGGQYLDPGAAEARAREMVEEGAQILDIGGESTRPGAASVPAEEELRRVLPVVQRLAGKIGAALSVDTRKAAVARACLDAGATLVNDVSGLTFDLELARVVARAQATLVLMHTPGTPDTMQHDPHYEDVVADTMRCLRRQMRVAIEAGISPDRLWIDPGFGFGKTAAHNLEILRRLREYTSIGAPILIGTSRKSTLGHVLGGLPESDRLEGTAATVAVGIAHGAGMVRVHDVKEMVRVARMTDAILGREKEKGKR